MTPELYEFIQAHGGPPVWIGRTMFLADGAAVADGPIYMPPPADPKHRLQARAKYWRTLAERTERELAKLEAALGVQGSVFSAMPWQWPQDRDWFYAHVGADPRDAKAARKKLREVADAAKAELSQVEAEIGPTYLAGVSGAQPLF
jgi:hypothetical protein